MEGQEKREIIKEKMGKEEDRIGWACPCGVRGPGSGKIIIFGGRLLASQPLFGPY